jgi:hypothetical protein
MKIGSSLALICIGAILAFAVTANTSVFNLHTAGWVLMLIGVIGLLLPNRTAGWLGRRLLVRRSYPSGRVEQIPVPPYIARNPGLSALQRGLPSRPTLLDPEADLIEDAEPGYDVIQETGPQGGGVPGDEGGQPGPVQQASPQQASPQPRAAGPAPYTEVIEDLYEQP